jgi:THO complex subunit 7
MAAIRTEHETQNRLIQNQKSALDNIIADLSSLRVFGKEPEAATTPLPHSLRGTPGPDGTPALPDADVASVPDSSFDSNSNAEEGGEDKRPPREGTSEGLVSEGAVEDDIEMGEVEEDPREKNKKKLREHLEEGEATDASSELSEPPDD